MLTLSVRFALIVPETRDLTPIVESLTEAAGGCTVTSGWGYWVDPEGETIAEPVRVVEVYTDRQGTGDVLVQIVRNAQYLLAEGEQSVAIQTPGGLVLLDAGDFTGDPAHLKIEIAETLSRLVK